MARSEATEAKRSHEQWRQRAEALRAQAATYRTLAARAERVAQAVERPVSDRTGLNAA